MAQSPFSSAVVSKTWPVSRLVTLTAAPGTAAPCGSLTTPSRRPVVTCAQALNTKATNNERVANFFTRTSKDRNVRNNPASGLNYVTGGCKRGQQGGR